MQLRWYNGSLYVERGEIIQTTKTWAQEIKVCLRFGFSLSSAFKKSVCNRKKILFLLKEIWLTLPQSPLPQHMRLQ